MTVKFMGCTRCFLRQKDTEFERAQVQCNLRSDEQGHVLAEFEDATAASEEVKKLHMYPCKLCPDAKFYDKHEKPNMKLTSSAVAKTCRNDNCEMHNNYKRELEALAKGKTEGVANTGTQLSTNARFKNVLKRLPAPAQAEFKRMHEEWRETQQAADEKLALLEVVAKAAGIGAVVEELDDAEPSDAEPAASKRAKREK